MKIVWLNSLALLLLGLLLSIAPFNPEAGWQALFLQPFRRQSPYFGCFAQVTNILWCAAATVWWLAMWQHRSRSPHHQPDPFLLVTSSGLTVLLLDEVFRITILLTKYGIPKLSMYLLYGTAVLGYFVVFQARIRQYANSKLLVAAIGLLTLSSAIDLVALPNQGVPTLLEGVLKLLGVLNLVLYSWQGLQRVSSPLLHVEWLNGGVLGLLLILLGYVQLSGNTPLIELLFTEPFQPDRPFSGALVLLTNILVGAAFTGCLLALQRSGGDRILVVPGLGLLLLLLDGQFRLTVMLDIYGKLPRIWLVLLYGTVATLLLVWGWVFRRRILKTPYGLLLVGMGWLALSNLVTLLFFRRYETPEVLVQSTRLLGALNLLVYLAQVCWQQMQLSFCCVGED